MELKTDRNPILPSLPTEEEKGDFDRITRFRKGQLSILRDTMENIYDDLESLLKGNFRLVNKTPPSVSAAGEAGEICYDSSYIYICVADSSWKRVAIGTWA